MACEYQKYGKRMSQQLFHYQSCNKLRHNPYIAETQNNVVIFEK